jgi:hypothetical protein
VAPRAAAEPNKRNVFIPSPFLASGILVSGAWAFEHDLDAAVLRAVLRGVVRGDGMRVAEPLGRDDVGVDACDVK